MQIFILEAYNFAPLDMFSVGLGPGGGDFCPRTARYNIFLH